MINHRILIMATSPHPLPVPFEMNMVQNESTALIVASAGGSAAVVDLLLAKGANKNLQDKVCDMHHTLSDIRKCCCVKYQYIWQLFLFLFGQLHWPILCFSSCDKDHFGAHIRLQAHPLWSRSRLSYLIHGQFGNSALMKAVERNRVNIVNALLANGADKDLQNQVFTIASQSLLYNESWPFSTFV